jgi:hypothetical protein
MATSHWRDRRFLLKKFGSVVDFGERETRRRPRGQVSAVERSEPGGTWVVPGQEDSKAQTYLVGLYRPRGGVEGVKGGKVDKWKWLACDDGVGHLGPPGTLSTAPGLQCGTAVVLMRDD